MPDGRIFVAGGDPFHQIDPPGFNLRFPTGEFIQPPYLDGVTTRPRITMDQVPDVWTAGNTDPITIPYTWTGAAGSNCNKAVLIRLGAVTNGFDQNQRFINLEVLTSSASNLTVKAPVSKLIAPPGWYMLFILYPRAVSGSTHTPCAWAKYIRII